LSHHNVEYESLNLLEAIEKQEEAPKKQQQKKEAEKKE